MEQHLKKSTDGRHAPEQWAFQQLNESVDFEQKYQSYVQRIDSV